LFRRPVGKYFNDVQGHIFGGGVAFTDWFWFFRCHSFVLRVGGLMTFMAGASAAASRAVIEHGSGWRTAKLARVRQLVIGTDGADGK
jgi:hypothetical protein